MVHTASNMLDTMGWGNYAIPFILQMSHCRGKNCNIRYTSIWNTWTLQSYVGRKTIFVLWFWKFWSKSHHTICHWTRSWTPCPMWTLFSVLNCSTPSLWKLLKFFQKESKYQEIRIAAVLRGENFKKKAKYVEDCRLANIVEEYSTREPFSYLKAISYHLTV